MSDITSSFAERTRASLRETLLDAATALLAEHGHAGLRMADVAAVAGVSRQTVYNEFGNKTALVEAVALRTTAEFLEGIRHRFDTAPDLLTGVHRAVVYTIEHGRENKLVAAALGTQTGEDLLPLLTTKGEPVLSAATELAATRYLEFLPQLGEPTARLLAETVTRLALSHLVLPTHPAAEAADMVCAALAPHLSTMECEK
ncbi:AcrR family transcriptional regulator [Amycolatopsis bartoniae]|uniref:TetR family transcriptional regulator n=1 Tax=Amycolatopsis bartoniae TaxID=941986 RepID=A0A8H9M3Y8_9PSEU|nr:TetR family transcriptional regulator [Amycolatopsis bartoniae]MBB2934954.1 AcrR family transcriptional regulator [Amycolatopsis bartoniae]TVS99137.1 TetR/AcrR family transcriptional regulator [Amycolatopsis bartoniae]GHF43561.1 TetR family transcriptional regulator [Amycolatopsis bartoniae]